MWMLGLVSGICNLLARFGVRIWCRVFLVPYLVFLLMLLASVFIQLGKSVKLLGMKEADILPIFAVLVIFYVWQAILRQWIFMSLPKPKLLLDRQ